MKESLLDEIIQQEEALQKRVSRVKTRIRLRLERKQSELEHHYANLKKRLQNIYANKHAKVFDQFIDDKQQQQKAFMQRIQQEKEVSDKHTQRHIRELLTEMIGVETSDHQNDQS